MKKKILLIALLSIVLPAFASNIIIEADKQTYQEKTATTVFEKNVKVQMDDITVKSPKAIVKMTSDNKIDKATFVNGAYAIKDNKLTQHEIKANIINLSLLNKKMKAKGNTQSVFNENRKPVVTINADSQEFDINTNLMKAKGSVVINYKDIKTFSDEANLKMTKDGDLQKVKLMGHGRLEQKGSVVKANTFIFNPGSNEIVAIGNTSTYTKTEDGDIVSVNANYQQFDRASNTLMTSGNVRITYKDYIAIGPKATFLPDAVTNKPNKIIFYGRSKIQENDRIIEADKIVLTMRPKNFSAEGNVRTSFKNVKGLGDSEMFKKDKK